MLKLPADEDKLVMYMYIMYMYRYMYMYTCSLPYFFFGTMTCLRTAL